MNGAQCDDVLLAADTDKPYVSQRMTVSADKYHSYLNLTAPSDEESGDESVQEEFKRWPHIPHNDTNLHYRYYVSLSPETQSQQRLEWAQELADLDTEISQLEATLRSKVRCKDLDMLTTHNSSIR